MSDFIVIGGGIAGLSAGAQLSYLGKVTVLEGESGLGYHASGRSAALFEAQYGLPSTVALNLASEESHRVGAYLSPRGLMLVAGPEEGAAFDREVVELGLNRLSINEACTLVPVLDRAKIGFAAHHDEAWDLDTDRMLQDSAKTIRANGGAVLTRRQVTAIKRNASGWKVSASEDFNSAHLVNAAGAWADQVAALAGIAPLGIVPHRRSMARLPAPGRYDVSGWPMIFGVNESWYAKPDAGKLLVSPAEEHAVEPHDAWADDMVLAEGLARYESMVTEPVTRVETSWAGLRSFAPDRALVLGPDPEDPAFIWCAGQGGYGFQTAPAASQLLAELVAGHTPTLPPQVVRMLRPDRLR